MIKIALPKGSVQDDVKQFLSERELEFKGYDREARAYASDAAGESSLFSKQFREKDIPIQVSIANYDLGLCGSQWVNEYLALYPNADMMILGTLDITEGDLCVCCSGNETEAASGDEVIKNMSSRGPVRIATQFPGLAEDWALQKRIPDFRIFPLWGAAEAYPPEGAELAVLIVPDDKFLEDNDLWKIETLFEARTFLIANKRLFEKKDLSPVLKKLA